jgi:glycosyltransferase involved in cell wall biosynthesis
MKFTIITPNYNGGKYLENCIKSVLNQKVDFEHIIVDCESTDTSHKILNKYPHLKIISEKDDGMYDAINKGISIANGDVITYLNSDDRFPLGSLTKVNELFSNQKLDYVYGDCKLIDYLENEIYIYKVPPISRRILKKITVVPWAQPSIFYRKYIFDYLGKFNINYSLASDYEFMKKVILSDFNGYRSKYVLSEFMVRQDALSYKYSKKMKSEGIEIKKNLGIKNRPLLDFFFNMYRKLYNFHSLLITIKK